MQTSGEARPDPKARTLARGPRRYRRKVASPKQWQAIQAAKLGACRVYTASGGQQLGQTALHFGAVNLHHVVTREDHGDDVADNLVSVCEWCHSRLHRRDPRVAEALLRSLSDAEYAYAIQRGGAGYFERAYGVRYER